MLEIRGTCERGTCENVIFFMFFGSKNHNFHFFSKNPSKSDRRLQNTTCGEKWDPLDLCFYVFGTSKHKKNGNFDSNTNGHSGEPWGGCFFLKGVLRGDSMFVIDAKF